MEIGNPGHKPSTGGPEKHSVKKELYFYLVRIHCL
jgi:hypothetical protein